MRAFTGAPYRPDINLLLTSPAGAHSTATGSQLDRSRSAPHSVHTATINADANEMLALHSGQTRSSMSAGRWCALGTVLGEYVVEPDDAEHAFHLR